MLAETVFDILRYFSRHELEGLQMHSRFLRDFVDRNVDQLPLRAIYKISTSRYHGGGVHVWLEENDEDTAFHVRALTDVNLRRLLDRLKSAFIERLETDFVHSCDIRFLRYLRDHGAELKCRINVLDVQTTFGFGFIADELVNNVAERLKPQSMRVDLIDAQRSPEAMLFNHGSMRRVIKHVHFNIGRNTLEASHLISGLLDVDALQPCGIGAHGDAMPWIVRFVDMFKTTNRGAIVVRTVAVVHSRGSDEPHSARDASNPLGKPQRKDVPVPHSEFAKVIRSCPSFEEVSTAEIFMFSNIELGKRLDIYKWSSMQTVEFVGRPPKTYEYAHYLLKTVDV